MLGLQVRSQLAATDRARLDRLRRCAASVVAATRSRGRCRAALAGWALAAAWAAAAAEQRLAGEPDSGDFAVSSARQPHQDEVAYHGAEPADGSTRDSQQLDCGSQNDWGGIGVIADECRGGGSGGVMPLGLPARTCARELARARLNRLSHEFMRGW